MKKHAIVGIIVSALTVGGCVSTSTHKEIVDELEQTKKARTQTAAELEATKKKAAAETSALQEEKTRLSNELLAAQTKVGQQQQKLDLLAKNMDATLEAQRNLETELTKLRREASEATRLSDELRRERDVLQTKAADLEKQLETSREELTVTRKGLGDANAHLAALENERKQLQSGAASAQEQIAQLQKRVGELETEAARAKDLEQRFQAMSQELGQLKQQAADREGLLAKTMALTQEQERLGLRLEAERAEKERLEQERAAKEAEIQRLKKTHDDLMESLKGEIEKGNVRIQQIRDRLTINMLDKVLFDSGRAEVKPAGLKVLKQVSDILKGVADKQIRIEGHTDNVPIGASIKKQFPTNWELSTARATSVIRYLIEKGGVDRNNISAGGYADTRPVVSNDTEEGRAANRRIEIVLYPKDLQEIAAR